MKLKQIKLAGFKTFVDPTTIKVDAQLAGIVGPNGCGKSNVTESVKWVLGSSSAKELRGGTMEDVIFYGSDTRQAISRASVELFFDNSEGIAPQAWASYAEISVKRIIEKEKGSSYFINNTQVRRKDNYNANSKSSGRKWSKYRSWKFCDTECIGSRKWTKLCLVNK